MKCNIVVSCGMKCNIVGMKCNLVGMKCNIVGMKCNIVGMKCNIVGMKCNLVGMIMISLLYHSLLVSFYNESLYEMNKKKFKF